MKKERLLILFIVLSTITNLSAQPKIVNESIRQHIASTYSRKNENNMRRDIYLQIQKKYASNVNIKEIVDFEKELRSEYRKH